MSAYVANSKLYTRKRPVIHRCGTSQSK